MEGDCGNAGVRSNHLFGKSGVWFATSLSRQRKDTRATVEMLVEKLLQKCCCWLVQHGKTESNIMSSPKDERYVVFSIVVTEKSSHVLLTIASAG